MEIIFFVAMLGVVLLLVAHAPKPGIPSTKPTCPPHSWLSEPVLDKAGEIEGYKLICTKCGPINKA